MLDRADSPDIQSLPPSPPSAFPAWARPKNPPECEAEVAFFAGAALSQLDAVVRQNPPWNGVFRRRLGLSAAAASVARAGRTEDETALRDAFHLARPGADPGPAGKHVLAWRELSARSAGQWRSSFHAAADALGVPHDEALQEAIEAAEACAGDNRPAPFAAAQIFGLARRALTAKAGRPVVEGRGGQGELLAAWLADAVLGQRLKWPFALPLLAAPLFSGGGRRAGAMSATPPTAPSCSPTPGRRRAPAVFRRSSDGGRKSCWRPSRSCAQEGREPRWGRCSRRIRLAPRRKFPDFPSADRDGCSTGWSPWGRCAN
jgi:Protein of unknown function (DUF1403)